LFVFEIDPRENLAFVPVILCVEEKLWSEQIITREVSYPFLVPIDSMDIDKFEFLAACEQRIEALLTIDKPVRLSNEMLRLKRNLVEGSGALLKLRERVLGFGREWRLRPSSECPFLAKSLQEIIVQKSDQNYIDKILALCHDLVCDSEESGGVEVTTLEECLAWFSMNEVLDEGNKWFCPKCRAFVCAEKKLDIWSVANIVIIHLKRFSEHGGGFSKIDRHIRCPEFLDLSSVVVGHQREGSLMYRLMSVVEHSGGMEGGHYIAKALVANYDEAEWWCFNDEIARKCGESAVQFENGYLLFYELIDPNEGQMEKQWDSGQVDLEEFRSDNEAAVEF
jgi:hypothetical protein